LVARRAHNPKVAGSSPAAATSKVIMKFMVTFFIEPNLKSKLD